MTDIKSAIQYGNDYYKDLISACCDISDRHKDYIKMANNSLNAWSEVLNELEKQIEFDNELGQTEVVVGLRIAINIINQKLAKIEE